MLKFLGLRKVVLLTVLLGLFVGFSYLGSEVGDGHSAQDVRTLNQSYDLLQEDKISEALEKLTEIELYAEDGSYLQTSAKYNRGTILAGSSGDDISVLQEARAVLQEALRDSPNDLDIKKNIEVISAMIVDSLRQSGLGESEAGEEADPNSEKWPSEEEDNDGPGDEYSPGTIPKKDF